MPLASLSLKVGSFLLLSDGKFGKHFDPSPLKNAHVLNGWSLRGPPVLTEYEVADESGNYNDPS